MILSGPTGSGKTLWIKKLIDNRFTDSYPSPDRIIYFYGEDQPIFDAIKNVEFSKGLDIAKIECLNPNKRNWLIIDDLMNDATNSSIISDLFTKGSHHRNTSVILTTQNFFSRGKENRNISLNANYIVLFKNPRDNIIASKIARQMYPNRTKWLQNIFEDATRDKYSYLLLDL